MATAEVVEPDTSDVPEPNEPIEGDDADAEDEQPEQTPAQAAAAYGSAETRVQLDKANDAYIAKVRKIVGDDAPIAGCDHCQGMGYLLGDQEPQPEPVHPPNLVTCEYCNGYGEVLTGSRHPDHITAMCIKCAGNGFITLPEQPAHVTPQPPPQVPAQAAQMGTLMPDGRFVPYGQDYPVTISQPWQNTMQTGGIPG